MSLSFQKRPMVPILQILPTSLMVQTNQKDQRARADRTVRKDRMALMSPTVRMNLSFPTSQMILMSQKNRTSPSYPSYPKTPKSQMSQMSQTSLMSLKSPTIQRRLTIQKSRTSLMNPTSPSYPKTRLPLLPPHDADRPGRGVPAAMAAK